MTINEAMKALRISKKLSMAQMGEVIGKTKGAITYYEHGNHVPEEVVKRLETYFQVRLTEDGPVEAEAEEPRAEEAAPVEPVKAEEPPVKEEKPETKAEEPAEEEKAASMSGERMRSLRAAYGLSQPALGRVVGKSHSSIVNYEKGVSKVPEDVAAKFEKWIQTREAAEKAAPAQEEPVKAEKTEKAEKAEKTEKTEKAEEQVQEAVKAAAQQGPNVFIQAMSGATISVEDVIKRIQDAVPTVDNIYVKPEENRAYWTAGKYNGSTVLW